MKSVYTSKHLHKQEYVKYAEYFDSEGISNMDAAIGSCITANKRLLAVIKVLFRGCY